MDQQKKLSLPANEISRENFSIIIPQGASFDEVQDTIFDVLAVIIILETAFKNGFDPKEILRILLKLLEAQPAVEEIINDFPVFMEQFTQLSKDDAVPAVVNARNQIIASGKEFGKISGFVVNLLYVTANGYKNSVEVYEKAQSQWMLFQMLFKGKSVFPGE